MVSHGFEWILKFLLHWMEELDRFVKSEYRLIFYNKSLILRILALKGDPGKTNSGAGTRCMPGGRRKNAGGKYQGFFSPCPESHSKEPPLRLEGAIRVTG